MKKTLIFTLALALTGCASSPYVYHVEPTQLQSNETKYSIGSVVVNLELGHGAIAGDETFASEQELVEQFTASLMAQMKEQGVYATEAGKSEFSVSFEVDYLRTYNHGGKALNKPQISHRVTVSDSTKPVASFNNDDYTTSYGTFGDAAVNIEIASFSWDEEDEPEDVEKISEYIIEALTELGS